MLGPGASEDDIQRLLDRDILIFIKPVFKGGVGKKGKSGLIGKATDLKTALAEKERLYFAEHRHGNAYAKANGVTFDAGGVVVATDRSACADRAVEVAAALAAAVWGAVLLRVISLRYFDLPSPTRAWNVMRLQWTETGCCSSEV